MGQPTNCLVRMSAAAAKSKFAEYRAHGKRNVGHARERALVLARQDPPTGVSADEAVAKVREVLDSIGDTCPECPPED